MQELLDPGLYLVATPIGNLEDITLRALRVLKGVDRIACEDTRQTQKLLNHFDISTSTISYHQHNEQARTAELLAFLQQGGRVAVVSDAGTPAFSDPGLELVRAAVAGGVRVIPIPGQTPRSVRSPPPAWTRIGSFMWVFWLPSRVRGGPSWKLWRGISQNLSLWSSMKLPTAFWSCWLIWKRYGAGRYGWSSLAS